MGRDIPRPTELILRATVAAVVLVPLPASIQAIRNHPAGEELDWGVYPAYFSLVAVAVGVPAGVLGSWGFCALAVAASTVPAATYTGSVGLGALLAMLHVLLCGLCIGMTRVTRNREAWGVRAQGEERRALFGGIAWTLALIFSALFTFVGGFLLMIPLPGVWQMAALLTLVGVAGLIGSARSFARRRKRADEGPPDALEEAEMDPAPGVIAFLGASLVLTCGYFLDLYLNVDEQIFVPAVAITFFVMMLKPPAPVVLVLAAIGVVTSLVPLLSTDYDGPVLAWPAFIAAGLIFTIFGWHLWDPARRSLAVGLMAGLIIGLAVRWSLIFMSQ